MNDLVSLNLEYLILKLYQLIFGSGIEVSELPRQGLGQVHDQGHHMRHAAELAANQTQNAKNPRWDGVLALVNSPIESDWRRAVIEADIMLQMMLTERGFAGTD